MKEFIVYIVVFTLIISCSSKSVDVNNNVVANANVQFVIDGMTCEIGCANRIEEKIAKMNGVSTSSVDFESKLATISFNDETITGDEIKSMVESLNDNQYHIKETVNNSDVDSDSHNENSTDDLNQVVSGSGFELPNILDFFTNII